MPVVWKIRKDGIKQRFNISPIRKKVVKLYSQGLSSRKVGEMCDVSHSRVLKILRLENVNRREITKPIILANLPISDL